MVTMDDDERPTPVAIDSPGPQRRGCAWPVWLVAIGLGLIVGVQAIGHMMYGWEW